MPDRFNMRWGLEMKPTGHSIPTVIWALKGGRPYKVVFLCVEDADLFEEYQRMVDDHNLAVGALSSDLREGYEPK